MHFAESINL